MEHANLALAAISEDIKHVHVRATAALGIAAVFVTQIELKELKALPEGWRVLIVAGMSMLLVSSIMYFLYSQELNKARIRVAKRGEATAGTIGEDWPHSQPGYSQHLWMYGTGQGLFVAGVVCLGLVIGRLLL